MAPDLLVAGHQDPLAAPVVQTFPEPMLRCLVFHIDTMVGISGDLRVLQACGCSAG